MKHFCFSVLILCLLSSGVWAGENGENADVNELLQQQKALQQSIAPINQLNPFSADYGKKLDPSIVISPNSSMANVQTFLSNGMIQAGMRLLASPAFSKAMAQITESPKRLMILYCEMAWLLFFLVFRAWRRSKLSIGSWIQALWLHLWTTILFIAVGSFLIPLGVLGEPYSLILRELWKVVFQRPV